VLAEKSTSTSSPGIIVFSSRATASENFARNRSTSSGVFDAQKSVIERVAQISLRETTRNHQWNAFVLERRHRLFATGTRAKVEAADNDVPRLRAPSKPGIVIFHHCARHHLGVMSSR